MKPKFDMATLPPVLDVEEASDLNIRLSSPAFVSSVDYVLYKSGSPVTDPRFSVSTGYLSISSVARSDRGSYRVDGTNGVGSASYNFTLNVQCELLCYLLKT